jgi:DNA repair ATPase RecN
MSRLKRNSKGLAQAIQRIAGMKSIAEDLEFGDGLSVVEYETRMKALQTQLAAYNTRLAELDEMAAEITQKEQELRNYSEKMLLAVAARYGKDSLPYMQAGGTIRKPGKRSSQPPTPLVIGIMPSLAPAPTNGHGFTVLN